MLLSMSTEANWLNATQFGPSIMLFALPNSHVNHFQTPVLLTCHLRLSPVVPPLNIKFK
jgi:hypothetical protein